MIQGLFRTGNTRHTLNLLLIRIYLVKNERYLARNLPTQTKFVIENITSLYQIFAVFTEKFHYLLSVASIPVIVHS